MKEIAKPILVLICSLNIIVALVFLFTRDKLILPAGVTILAVVVPILFRLFGGISISQEQDILNKRVRNLLWWIIIGSWVLSLCLSVSIVTAAWINAAVVALFGVTYIFADHPDTDEATPPSSSCLKSAFEVITQSPYYFVLQHNDDADVVIPLLAITGLTAEDDGLTVWLGEEEYFDLNAKETELFLAKLKALPGIFQPGGGQK